MPVTPDSMRHLFFLTCGRLVPPETDSEVEISEQKVYRGGPWG